MSGLPPLFDAPWRGYDTGVFPNFGPSSLAVGDLDGDGDLDVVVGRSYFGGPGVSVLFNHGDGSYATPVHYNLPFNKSAGEVALADIDRDGRPDVLATVPDANGLTNVLALWRNAGNGTLLPRVEFPTGPGPHGLVVADFTGDGFPDVATANYGYVAGSNNNISLLQHNGLTGAAAGFLPPVQFTVGGRQPRAIAAADLNGDGLPDLAVGRIGQPYGPTTYPIGVIDVLFNNGAGGFTLATSYPSVPPEHRGGTSAVALADLDNDGDADLIAGGGASTGSIDFGMVSVRRNLGNGTFGGLETHRFANFVWVPSHLTAGDLNGDGYADVIATTPSGRANDGYNVLLSDGAGGFRPAAFYEASKQTVATAAADADRDGDLDIIAVAQDSAVITVRLNPGSGVFPVLPRYEVGVLSEALDAADLDRDGDLDIVTVDTQVRILRNNGDGTFAPAQTFVPPLDQHDVRLRDLNGDGYPDLILGPGSPRYHLVTALNRGDGTFAPGVVTPTFSCGYGRVEAGDLDNDGDNDVVLTEERTCFGGDPIPRIFLYRNDGAGNLTLLPPIMSLVGFPNGIALADLNFDGNLDLVSSVSMGVGVWLGNGDLTFRAPLVSGTRPYQFALADMDRDGRLDVALIVPQPSFGTVSIGVSLGNGNGTFNAAQQLYPAASGLEGAYRISNDIDVADLNLDSYPDLVVSNNAPGDISLFLNNGDGTLGPHRRYGAGYSASVAFVADFTGDGIPDVAPLISLPPAGFGSAVVLLRGVRLQPRPVPQAATPIPVRHLIGQPGPFGGGGGLAPASRLRPSAGTMVETGTATAAPLRPAGRGTPGVAEAGKASPIAAAARLDLLFSVWEDGTTAEARNW